MCPVHPQNAAALESLRQKYYFPALERAYQTCRDAHGLPAAADHITDAMRASQPAIEQLIQQRVADGAIQDASQARKVVAGNAFQTLALRVLIAMQESGMIPAEVIFALKPKRHPLITAFATIRIGDETLKPDLDLLAYTEASDVAAIYSLKTSLRERAGQTQRWKLLLDIATAPDCDSIKAKYKLNYNGKRRFVMGLITTNFYDEIMAPQQRGLLRFFDYVYLTKPGAHALPVSNFSQVAADLSNLYAPAK